MGMKHFTSEQWDLYAEGQLPDEERRAYEAHLSSCESCLEWYMQSLERAACAYPELEDEARFTEAVMARIDLEHPLSPPAFSMKKAKLGQTRRVPAFTRNPLFHYTVAAVITVILMSSGAFQSLTDSVGYLETATETTGLADSEQSAVTEGPTSVSYKIMEKTIVMLDSIKARHEQGGVR